MLFKNTTEKAVDSVGTIVGEGTKKYWGSFKPNEMGVVNVALRC
ncbi:hypothetical protein JP008_05190 [Staphylococcus aureus]|nr:hypothetical protein JP008_05190 [Staphylococcus aureus]